MVIPQGWSIKRIGDLADIYNGTTPSTANSKYWNGNIFWCTPTDITKNKSKYIYLTERTITQKGLIESGLHILPKGTILLCTRATIGDMCISAVPITTNQGFKNLICKENVSTEFLYYMLLTKKWTMIEKSIGTTFLELQKSALSNIEVCSPDNKQEQEAIATVLSDTDNLIESLEKLIAKKKLIKQGVMQELLTGKKRLTGFGEEWQTKNISDIFQILKGSGLSKTKLTTTGKYGCVLYGELFTTYRQAITNVYSKTNYAEGVISQYGDILMPGSTTTTGIDLAIASTILANNIKLGGDINVLRTNKPISPIFFAYLLTYIYKNQIAELAQGITIIHLHPKNLATLSITIPDSPQEQEAIATILTDMDSEISALEQKLEKYRLIKTGMMQELLAGRIRLVNNKVISIDFAKEISKPKGHNQRFEDAVVYSFDLEVLATVDMARCDLQKTNKQITVESIKQYLASIKEWADKLKKDYFTDTAIQSAIDQSQRLFG